ncbi:MAG: M28 family peptidase [Acidobacteriota bacterium]|nr:M28 family peptidase [Acidobacteriota bacterium]
MTARTRKRVLIFVGATLFLLAGLLALIGVLVRGPAVFSVPAGFDPRPVSEDRLRRDVDRLCGEFMPRDYGSPENLDRVAEWIAGEFRGAGLDVREQPYVVEDTTFRNVIGTRPGSDPDAGSVIVGAHYDTAGPLPGADDNASSVAVLLELVRTLPKDRPRRTRIFVAFSTEEPPFFSTEAMGSHHFAQEIKSEAIDVELMIALDCVGYFSDEPDSQLVPVTLLRLYYPSEGNFIGVVGDTGAGAWIRTVKRGMRSANALPVLSFRGPSAIPGIDWSDHYWFRRLGLPGVLVTDTAMMRNPNYHRPTDRPETLDFEKMVGVVQGLHGVLQDE